MNYEEKLKKFIEDNNIICKYFSFENSCHSVKEASETANVPEENFVKNICFIDSSGELIVAIVKGEDKIDKTKIETFTKIKVKIASLPEILEKTGYPCGGVPSFGYSAKFVIDERVILKDLIYTGGGTERTLIEISSKELIKINNGIVMNIRKD